MTLTDAQINKLCSKLMNDLVKTLNKFLDKNPTIDAETLNKITVISMDLMRELVVEKVFANLSSALNYLDFSHRDLTQKIKFIHNKGKHDVAH
jgi:hypothetical protein